MNIKSDNNIISIKKMADGTMLYVVSLGTIIYNNNLVNLNNLVIPLFNQTFFDLPNDLNKYAVVNVYYNADIAQFVFDKIGVYNNFINRVSAPAIHNALPLVQFILRQDHQSFVVDHYNEYSQMATFSISDDLTQGIAGLRGDLGNTGQDGHTGIQGDTGFIGLIGLTGYQGPTGVGAIGYSGPQGVTGYFPDPHLILYLKFKSDDYIQTDYSIYERDVTWGISGSGPGSSGVLAISGFLGSTGFAGLGLSGIYGITGVLGLSSIGATGTLSYFIRKEGVVDNCHTVYYAGAGYSAYKRNIFLPFGETGGNISAWMKLESNPISDFVYEVTEDNILILKFTDNSYYFPIEWLWDFGDGTTGTGETVYHKYAFPGEYLVSLTATNYNGSSIKYKLIVVPNDI